jgi:D-alanine transaminase
MPLAEAMVPVLDRGFVFGDGVYEVIPVDSVEGVRAPFRAVEHLRRLGRSLEALRIDPRLRVDHWLTLLRTLIDRHPWARQAVYVQVTRGVARRDHVFPAGVAPTVLMTTTPWPEISAESIERGVSAVTHADERWLHCDIKCTSLVANVLMKQYAAEHDAFETVLFRDGMLTECSTSNVFAVKDGTLLAPPKSNLMLPGITYDVVVELARAHGSALQLRALAEAEVRAADELWLTSSGREVLAITRLDGDPVGSGVPGPVFLAMLEWFRQAKRDDARAWAERSPPPHSR